MNGQQASSRHLDYLDHMIEAIELIRSFTDGLEKADFLADRKTQQAVVLNIIVIGEAATKIAAECPDVVARNADVPWQQMRGMRNRMAHGYFDINLDVVWDTVRTSLPALEIQLRTLKASG